MTILADLIERNRTGECIGLPSFCTANEYVLRAVLRRVVQTGEPALIEATCNQVNQEGGYTGMDPAGFMAWIGTLTEATGAPRDRIILGGDHLGPNPWKDLPEAEAMENARILVRDFAAAGFTKLHLDASMPLGGEAPPDFETIARRAADLCRVAETHAPDTGALSYVIGTEVPIPGGEQEEPDALDVTSVARFRATIQTHLAAFRQAGLDAAWDRVIAVVTQPGVDFGASRVWPFDPAAAAELSAAVRDEDGIAFEAHSTDYQPNAALADLVRGHFAILKVGPELTFRFREAIFALAEMERTLAPEAPSRIREVLSLAMEETDRHWRGYYDGTPDEIVFQRSFALSDRIRYYWAEPEVAAAMETLLSNLRAAPLPVPLVTQHFGWAEFGAVPDDPDTLIDGHVGKCIDRYFQAAGFGTEPLGGPEE